MKLLITGANGLLGQKLIAATRESDKIQVIGTGRGPDRNPAGPHQYRTLDVTDRKEVLRTVADVAPDAIINTAAMTQVDQCETDRDACWEQNVGAV
ncbi:MAG: sugar nucleotide-binding protein, partial [Bacteroidota bacterium]